VIFSSQNVPLFPVEPEAKNSSTSTLRKKHAK
jgi:hypothetical protein